MFPRITCAAVGLLATLAAGAASASQLELIHVNRIFLTEFNTTSGYGDNPLSIAFDGTNAYVGGWNSTTDSPGTVGVIRVSDMFSTLGSATQTPLPATLINSPTGRGLDAVAWDATTQSIIMAHDSGDPATSLISRRDATGANVWTVMGPQGARPFSAAIDPSGHAGAPGVAFLVQGSGRRRLLSLVDGSTVYDGTNGGIVNNDPNFWGTAWRAMAFDSAGNIAITEDSGYQYGKRIGDNQWQNLVGTNDRTSGSVRKNVDANLVGQGIVIMPGLGPNGDDLIAFSGRNMTQLTALDGSVTSVSDTHVHIRNLDGTITGLSQMTLLGNEGSFSSEWANNTKNLAFGIDAASGLPTLLVLDFVERRLDVYQIPEPATAGLLALSALAMLRRRRI